MHPSSTLPLSTPSLRLRHFVMADVPVIMALNAEASTRHWLPSHVYGSLDDAADSIGYLIACYASPGDPRFGPYVLAVEHAASGELLGHVGFSPLDGGKVEVSYAIAEAARGRGHGNEALVPACDWACRACGLPGLWAATAAANLASRRLLERAGFTLAREEVVRFQGIDAQRVARYWLAAPRDDRR